MSRDELLGFPELKALLGALQVRPDQRRRIGKDLERMVRGAKACGLPVDTLIILTMAWCGAGIGAQVQAAVSDRRQVLSLGYMAAATAFVVADPRQPAAMDAEAAKVHARFVDLTRALEAMPGWSDDSEVALRSLAFLFAWGLTALKDVKPEAALERVAIEATRLFPTMRDWHAAQPGEAGPS